MVWIFIKVRETSIVGLPGSIEKIVNKLTAREDVIAVILFGSRARGDAYPFSDYDIAVVLKKGASRRGIESLSGKNVDVVVFNDLPPYMKYSILKEGKILAVRDKNAFEAAKQRAILEFLDVAMMYRRYGVRV